MRSNRSSGTVPELTLSRLLRKKISKNDLPGRPDFVYPKTKLAVFLHGCFWHRCPECRFDLPKTNRDFWSRKFARNKERDAVAISELKGLGWDVIVVWEHELKANPEAVVRRICEKRYTCR